MNFHLTFTFKNFSIQEIPLKNMAIIAEIIGYNYGDLKAVDDISFNVDEGEILGFLEPNGAGKSTTVKMLSG
jgi:ABC-2 type transport system ATP-binding protein